ncbi:DUF342 domain-containing protein [Pseudoalteromonas sp. MMG010]|uniref:DUF342 domain-containing protein n=1 Tax=Pseudoalteromonas sp. MMG010 TaxID=2822685 RepID=UPI001B3A24EB|nr:FapA family protein [Pseudoalteromonas sp. MMG010]MBQ4831876.1 DUF342 domain-containing protein [Pseudoalteromonas sp. MMG010]
MSVFSLDEATGAVSINAHPQETGFPVTGAQLVELLENSEFAEFEILNTNIGKLFAPGNDVTKASLVIARCVDASIEITINDTNMIAEATLTTAMGGKLLSVENAHAAIKKAGIKKGVNAQALDTFLGQQFERAAGTQYSAIIAHGRKPTNGTDAKFVRLAPTAQDRVLSPQAKDGGKVDMKNLGAIITVKPGTALMQRIPATAGENGYTLFGDEITAAPGKEHQLTAFDGTKIDPTNPDLLIANSKGVPVALPRGMRVDDVLCFDNIDVSTGHVEFDGSIIVSGDIKDGMKVKANGDITVLGFVESAHVQSNNAITIMLGAIGRKRENDEAFTCEVLAKRTISIGYAQYCHIETALDLLIDRQALHCDLTARRLIRVGKGKNPQGKLIGGNIHNAMRLEAGEVGAPSGAKTRIFLAQNWFDLRDQQSKINDFEKRLAKKAVELRVARKKAQQISVDIKKQKILHKIQKNEQQVKNHSVHILRQKKMVQQKISRLLASSRLKINDLMHPGVELKIAKDSKQFSRIYPPHLVKLSEGKITQSF